jgi:sterol desaturase/sphingolipid hydroxylase (fatty acid hydroxylase superfamily)
MIKGLFKKMASKISIRKENIAPLIVSLIIAIACFIIAYYTGHRFIEIAWIINLGIISILLAILMAFAGFTVLKSLISISVEISLMIFLAQSYCEAPNHLPQGDEALRSLLILGIMFIAGSFIYSLYKNCIKRYELIRKEKWSKEKITLVSLFAFFAIMIVWQIVLIITPIILNLCVLK